MINIDWNAGGITRGYVPPLKGIFGDGLTSNIFVPNAYQQMLEDTAPKIRAGIEPIENFAERFTKQILGVNPTPKTIQVNKEQIDKLFNKGSNITEVVSENVVEKPNKLNIGKIPFVGGIAKKVSPWVAPVLSVGQTIGNEQQLREMEKWNELTTRQGKPPMYSQEALDAQRKRSTASASPIAGAIAGSLMGPGGALLGGAIGELANIYQNWKNKDLYNTLQLPQFKGPNGEVVTKADVWEEILKSKKGTQAEEVKAKEEIQLPNSIIPTDYSEDWINELVALHGIGNTPELRPKATIEEGAESSTTTEQATPQEVYDRIYEELSKSREKALENQRANIEQLIDAYKSDVSNLRKANLTDTLVKSLVGIANPQWQVTMPMLSGNVTYGSIPNPEATPATDYIKSAPMKSDVVSTVNKLQEASDKAEIETILKQQELLDKIDLAKKTGVGISFADTDLLKEQWKNNTEQLKIEADNYNKAMDRLVKATTEAEKNRARIDVEKIRYQIAYLIAQNKNITNLATGYMNYASLGNDASGLGPIADVFRAYGINIEPESEEERAFNNLW